MRLTFGSDRSWFGVSRAASGDQLPPSWLELGALCSGVTVTGGSTVGPLDSKSLRGQAAMSADCVSSNRSSSVAATRLCEPNG
jgi:hypothetical protein